MSAKRAGAQFIGSRERKALMNRVGTSQPAVSMCEQAGRRVKNEAMDNIEAGFTMTSSKGAGLNEWFTQELLVMQQTLDSFPAAFFKREKVLSDTTIPVVIVSYGTDEDSYGPVFGSLWEFGSSGRGKVARPHLAPLSRAFKSVGKGT